MAPSKTPATWDDEESDSGDSSSQPSPQIVARRSKFEDEEDDSDVLESWDAAEDSEVEREKAKKAAEVKAKAEAEAKAKHKSRSQRIEERLALRRQQQLDMEETDEEETEAEKRARLRESEKLSDLAHAEDLFAGVGGVPATRAAAKPVTIQQGDDPADAIDLSALKIFNPTSVADFKKLRETLVPLITRSAKKPQYELFMKEFSKEIVQNMNSEQIKKVASGLTALSNEKMREEKAAEKGGKKTKAAKTKASLSASRDIAVKADTTLYDDGLDDGDFM